MLALSVRQPWASLIASGVKTVETRRWRTAYRGPLLICASAGPPLAGLIPTVATPPEPLPRGVAVCIVDLVDCRPMGAADVSAACVAAYPGAFAWVLENVRPAAPIRVRGNTRLFTPPQAFHATRGPPRTPR